MPKPIKYDSSVASITINEKGIYLFNLKDTYTAYNKIELENQFEFFNKNSNGKPYKVIFDANDSINMPTDDAGLYFRENNRPDDRYAIVSNKLPIQIFMGNLIKNKNVKNANLFKTNEEAMSWLMADPPK